MKTETLIVNNDYNSQDCKTMSLPEIISDNLTDVQNKAKTARLKHNLITITTIIQITEDSYEHTGSEH